ncbi:acetate--CoA ligase [Sulfidibacter corallicola]|uniref:acetate--CoA ligase n=1 Tax=Sulfidibacter corallicola TaxID=2818388 RepID=A0A8A4TUK0_SULCO|nr:acetate--CoA ligase [Sulfidibacter corallicola]QTD53646.1 acetate--CoA ligase [Sulfidibacter corallicola]
MRTAIIEKRPRASDPSPNLTAAEAASFRYDRAARDFQGLPDGKGLNIAFEAIDRHAAGPLAETDALRWLGLHGEEEVYTYRMLRAWSNRFANVLKGLGVTPGERVFALMPRLPELYIATFGILKARCVFSPLFSAFGPEPIQARMALGQGTVLLTTPRLYKTKVAAIRKRLPDLQHVILVGRGHQSAEIPGTLDFASLVNEASDDYEIGPTPPETMALLHFTSGTTGTPKGAVHVHDAALHHYVTGKYALDLHPRDIFWCTADPGWVTGTTYGIISPFLNGVTSVVDVAEFDADRWYRILHDEQVSVWYTAPTAIRMLMKAGAEKAREYTFPHLRFIASVGEPLNPEAVHWGTAHLGLPIHDNWWQTETGGIMIANTAAMDVKPGSMGKPLPAIEAAVVRREGGRIVPIEEPEVEGELAIRTGWPSMFRDYLNQPERYAACFADGWYLSGDLAKRDADGYFWFVGRGDDVIKSAGHLIGPFEVESVLIEHPAVAEAAVIGLPDEVAGERVKAFVALNPGIVIDDDLRKSLRGHARKRLGAAVAPRDIDILAQLPKTRSGKIMRRLLKARELGLPEGDTSTLEAES